ncbi:MAG: hypothetical protein K2N08_08645, partial [Muribaculaceae bacterium]|nr:hypothetical protein [Muribaculaceae bacterium]
MKNFKLLYACLIALIGLFITTGCSDKGDGPDMPEVNYNKLKIGRMDLSGAVSVGLKTGDSSRAIEGEYLSSGMYKIDANGNISAVAVYFTTDTLGNRLEHEEKLRIVPEELFNLTKNYLLVVDCSYYDRDGDEVSDKWEYNEENEEGRWIKQDVPYKHLLVRKSDGKIWCVDNIKDEILEHYFAWKLKGNFVESNRGDLYFIDRAAYKFNLSSDDASFEQITTGDGVDNLFNDAHEYIVTDNGIIGQTDGYNVYFGYPHSGFTTIDRWDLFKKTRVNFPEEIPVEGLEIGEYSDFKWKLSDYLSYDDFVSTILDENSFYLITWQSYELLCKYKSDYKCFYTKDISERKNLNKIATETNALLPSIFKITPGNNPGEYNLAEIAKLEVDMDFN